MASSSCENSFSRGRGDHDSVEECLKLDEPIDWQPWRCDNFRRTRFRRGHPSRKQMCFAIGTADKHMGRAVMVVLPDN